MENKVTSIKMNYDQLRDNEATLKNKLEELWKSYEVLKKKSKKKKKKKYIYIYIYILIC